MTQQAIQSSFNSGEWSPKLYSRVDLVKYRSGAALLENFFVDYRGGASTRPGTKYILQCFKSDAPVRLIPFQASFNVGYVLEFGEQYIRFFFDGAPVLETPLAIDAITLGPLAVDVVGSSYSVDDWIFITGVASPTQINDRYYRVASVVGTLVTLTDLNGNPVNTTGWAGYTSGGTAARVYTIQSPYISTDLHLLKYAQNVSQLIICHPNYQPYILTLVTATNWTMLPITFGTTAQTPGTVGFGFSLSMVGGNSYYSYQVTSIDANGQESSPAQGDLGPANDIRTTAGTITIGWTAAPGAVGYNIYRAQINYDLPVPAGQVYGYIGTSVGLQFVDDNIGPDFSQTPPISKNPFEGLGIASVLVTFGGTYTSVPIVSFTGAASTIAASAAAVLGASAATVAAGGSGYVVGDSVAFTNGVVLLVASVSGGAVTAWDTFANPNSSQGTVSSGSTPANPVVQLSTSGAGVGATANLTWGVRLIIVTNPGSGYTSIPTVAFSSGAATAAATLQSVSNSYPSVPSFFQQRLVLAAPDSAPQTFFMSQPGAYFNYNVSTIAQATDAITGTLVSGQLNTIKSMVPQTSGLLMFTDRNSWLINGGSGPGSAISPSALVANAQSFNGISDVPPIIANFDVLYVQAKGSIIRDSAYNIYANVYTGTDISAISSHLFYGFTVTEWAWAEEPFKVVWAIRDDGVMLTLTFLKEQEFIGWAHSITQGAFKSVTTVVEATATAGEVDAIYTVVERVINGIRVKYIERIAERTFPNGVEDAWCVDCGIRYEGAPATTFSGAEFLAGQLCTGIADGVVFPSFVMPASGSFTLATPASKVTVGLGFQAKLQTLPLELGDPTVQGKVKKINYVDIIVADTLGLQIGGEFGVDNLVPMKDLVIGNVSSMLTGQSSQIVTDLVTGQARTFIEPRYTIPGQYCIQQFEPLPATILGVVPNITVGDGGERGR